MIVSTEIRPGRGEHLEQVVAIYNHQVVHGHATFDESPVTPGERAEWITQFSVQGPHRLLVATDGDLVLGYASSAAYRQHPAFRRTVETSIYLHPDATGRGIGGRLYDRLLNDLADTPARCVVAGVALPNDASVALHLSRNFRAVGTFHDYAIKHGTAISSTWFERPVVL